VLSDSQAYSCTGIKDAALTLIFSNSRKMGCDDCAVGRRVADVWGPGG
jgi:hypothetical protein